jgi:hypothetical protein
MAGAGDSSIRKNMGWIINQGLVRGQGKKCIFLPQYSEQL